MKIRPIFKTIDIFSFIQFLSRQTNYIIKFFLLKVLYLVCQSAHLYVWDEPLNYIDVFSRMQLEELLRACRPAMLLVEHDQAFLEGLADKRVKLVPA